MTSSSEGNNDGYQLVAERRMSAQDDDGLMVMSEENQEQQLQQQQQQERRNFMVRTAVGIVLGVCLTLIVIDSLGARKVEGAILSFLEWVEENPYKGVLAVICVYIIATILFVPGSILTLGAGYAFGSGCNSTLEGTLLASTGVFIGASLGSICAFLLGRYLFRDCVVRLASTYPMFQAIDRALQGNGLKIMVLLRLSPLIPYNALDYMSGITSIRLWHYALAMFGMLPGTIMFCFVGASASSLSDTANQSDNRKVNIITLVAGIFFAGCGVFVASYHARVELDRILEEQREENESNHLDSTPLAYSSFELDPAEEEGGSLS